jgi:transcriptional regulator with XRE-family HTH domain
VQGGDLVNNGLTISKKITYRNMQARRVGRGITYCRVQIMDKSIAELAEQLEIDANDLERLEEGYEPMVDRSVLENIAKFANVNKRGSKLSDDELLNVFMNV